VPAEDSERLFIAKLTEVNAVFFSRSLIYSRQGKAAFETNVVLNEMSDLKYEK